MEISDFVQGVVCRATPEKGAATRRFLQNFTWLVSNKNIAPPDPQKRIRWKNLRGGLGVRDFWDAVHAMVQASRKIENGETLLFKTCSDLPEVAIGCLGGMYGLGFRNALVRAFSDICPEVLLNVDPEKRLEDLRVRLKGSFHDEVVSYIEQLCISIRKEKNKVCAGVLNHFTNHFMKTLDDDSSHEKSSATIEEVVECMKKYPNEARQYLKVCRGRNVDIDIHIDDTQTSISLNLEKPVNAVHLNGLLRRVVSGIKVNETSVIEILAKGLAYAEHLWENAERIV